MHGNKVPMTKDSGDNVSKETQWMPHKGRLSLPAVFLESRALVAYAFRTLVRESGRPAGLEALLAAVWIPSAGRPSGHERDRARCAEPTLAVA